MVAVDFYLRGKLTNPTLENVLAFLKGLFKPTPTLTAFTGVTTAHGPSQKPTAYQSSSCSLTTATGSNHA